MIQAFSYPPILKGFIVLLLAGCFFPLTGIFVLKLNLIPLRFTLMHGTLLGGAAALASTVSGAQRRVRSSVGAPAAITGVWPRVTSPRSLIRSAGVA